jgi:hypothetical protein
MRSLELIEAPKSPPKEIYSNTYRTTKEQGRELAEISKAVGLSINEIIDRFVRWALDDIESGAIKLVPKKDIKDIEG